MRTALPLEDRIRAVALDREADALESACRVGARLELLPLEPAPLGVAGQHAEEVACPERRLVAARRLADLDDHVLAVGRIGLYERELQLVLQPLDPLLELRDELAEIAVVVRSLEVGRSLNPLLRELVRRLELLQAPADLRRFAVVVVDGRVGHSLLRLGIGALHLVDEVLHRSHVTEVSRVGCGQTRARPG